MKIQILTILLVLLSTNSNYNNKIKLKEQRRLEEDPEKERAEGFKALGKGLADAAKDDDTWQDGLNSAVDTTSEIAAAFPPEGMVVSGILQVGKAISCLVGGCPPKPDQAEKTQEAVQKLQTDIDNQFKSLNKTIAKDFNEMFSYLHQIYQHLTAQLDQLETDVKTVINQMACNQPKVTDIKNHYYGWLYTTKTYYPPPSVIPTNPFENYKTWQEISTQSENYLKQDSDIILSQWASGLTFENYKECVKGQEFNSTSLSVLNHFLYSNAMAATMVHALNKQFTPDDENNANFQKDQVKPRIMQFIKYRHDYFRLPYQGTLQGEENLYFDDKNKQNQMLNKRINIENTDHGPPYGKMKINIGLEITSFANGEISFNQNSIIDPNLSAYFKHIDIYGSQQICGVEKTCNSKTGICIKPLNRPYVKTISKGQFHSMNTDIKQIRGKNTGSNQIIETNPKSIKFPEIVYQFNCFRNGVEIAFQPTINFTQSLNILEYQRYNDMIRYSFNQSLKTTIYVSKNNEDDQHYGFEAFNKSGSESFLLSVKKSKTNTILV